MYGYICIRANAHVCISIRMTRYSKLDAFLLTRYYAASIRNRACEPLTRSHACRYGTFYEICNAMKPGVFSENIY